MMRRWLVCLLLAIPAAAGTIEPMDLSRLRGQSSLVILGSVVGTRVTLDSPGVYEKLSVVRVVSVLQGTYTKPTLRVRTRTGLVFFDRHLEPKESGVLFLKPSQYGDAGDYESAYPGSFALFPH